MTAKFTISMLSACVGLGAQIACANTSVNYMNDTSVYNFEDIKRAASQDDMNSLYNYESSMQGTLFAMYPTYHRLNEELSYQSPANVINFSRQYPNTVMGEKLVADFAEDKARVGDYASVREVANYISNADDSESCAIALGYNQSSQYQQALGKKDDVWLFTENKGQPELCDKLAYEMAYNKGITQNDRYDRLVRMMRIDRRQLSSKRPPVNKEFEIVQLAGQLNLPITQAQLSNIRANPNGFITQFYQNPTGVNQYLYLYAINQLALRSYSEAATQLSYDVQQNQSRRFLEDNIIRYAWRSIAVMRMNMNTDHGFGMDSVTYFKNSLGVPFNREEAEDYAQAAIYFGQWQDVLNAVNAMDNVQKNERNWQYWQARALEMTNNKAAAKRIYQALSVGIDYYGLLAKDRLGQRLTLQDVGGNVLPSVGMAERNYVYSNPSFARALKLMEVNAAESDVNREWNWAVREARKNNDVNLILWASAIAQSMGNYSRSIQAIETTDSVRNAALSHPTPYQNQVVNYSRSVGIDPAWAYGIMRQESRFVAHARSSADARGLMQMLPGTAKQVARSLGESAGDLYNPDTSIRYGTKYLADKLGDFNHQIVVATAGYNAGSTPARAWLPKQGSMSADQYVEAIPYAETRAYVKHIMENAAIYSVLLGNNISISQRMGTVSPVW